MCNQDKIDEMVLVLVAEAITHYYLHITYVNSPDGFYKILRNNLDKEIRREIGHACSWTNLNEKVVDALMDCGREAANKIANFWIVQGS
jgi:hypothetical protein